MIEAVLFDLDGTLLDIDMSTFMPRYLQALASSMAHLADPARLIDATPGREGLDVLQGRARLVDAQGRDVTQAFIAGARAVLAQALAAGVTQAWLKDLSPSCAHDPQGANPRGGPGQGVLTALLLQNGVQVIEVRS